MQVVITTGSGQKIRTGSDHYFRMQNAINENRVQINSQPQQLSVFTKLSRLHMVRVALYMYTQFYTFACRLATDRFKYGSECVPRLYPQRQYP